MGVAMPEASGLRLADLPAADDRRAVFAFAMTFNGYEHYGSLEASVSAAREKKRESIDDLRNELFIAARASRHSDSDAYLTRYAELLPYFRKLIVA